MVSINAATRAYPTARCSAEKRSRVSTLTIIVLVISMTWKANAIDGEGREGIYPTAQSIKCMLSILCTYVVMTVHQSLDWPVGKFVQTQEFFLFFTRTLKFVSISELYYFT